MNITREFRARSPGVGDAAGDVGVARMRTEGTKVFQVDQVVVLRRVDRTVEVVAGEDMAVAAWMVRVEERAEIEGVSSEGSAEEDAIWCLVGVGEG